MFPVLLILQVEGPFRSFFCHISYEMRHSDDLWDLKFSRTVLSAAARFCLARDFLMGVVRVMLLSGGRHLLFPDGPGSAERGSCAAGNDGGRFYGRGRQLAFRGCRFFAAPGADGIAIR